MSSSPWPTGFAEGVRLFDTGAFFEAHEAFEELLDVVEEDRRWDLLVALMLGLGLEKLAAFPDQAWGVDVGALRTRVTTDRAAAEEGRQAPADGPRLGVRLGT